MSDTKIGTGITAFIKPEHEIRVYAHRTGTEGSNERVLRFGSSPWDVTIFLGGDDSLLWRLKKEIEAHFEGATKPEPVVGVSDAR